MSYYFQPASNYRRANRKILPPLTNRNLWLRLHIIREILKKIKKKTACYTMEFSFEQRQYIGFLLNLNILQETMEGLTLSVRGKHLLEYLDGAYKILRWK